MKRIINQFSYESLKDFHERAFSELLGSFIFILTGFSYEGIREVQSARGRADLIAPMTIVL